MSPILFTHKLSYITTIRTQKEENTRNEKKKSEKFAGIKKK